MDLQCFCRNKRRYKRIKVIQMCCGCTGFCRCRGDARLHCGLSHMQPESASYVSVQWNVLLFSALSRLTTFASCLHQAQVRIKACKPRPCLFPAFLPSCKRAWKEPAGADLLNLRLRITGLIERGGPSHACLGTLFTHLFARERWRSSCASGVM